MRRVDFLLVAAALALFWAMAVSVSPRNGTTSDEVVHLTGGYTYWKLNDYRMHPENGTLPMRIAALPLLGMNLKLPPLDDPSWLDSKVNVFGGKFFEDEGNPVDAMLLRGRMMIALVGAVMVWLTWRWARGLFGRTAGLIALTLAAFSPTMLAHAGLATSDMMMTACVIGALSLVWRMLHRLTWLRLLGAALVCGLAFLSKMSGVLIVPLIALMVLVRWIRGTPWPVALGGRVRWLRTRASIVGATVPVALVVAAGSLVVLWAGYGFRYEGFNRATSQAHDYYLSWDVILDRAPLPPSEKTPIDALVTDHQPVRETGMTHLVGWLRDHRLLPEAYLWGFAQTYKFSQYRPAFFLGDYRTTGWKLFFPVAFVLKTTLPALVLVVAGVLALFLAPRARALPRRVKPWLYRATPLLAFFVVYATMAINMHLNIGHRHILPLYPIFFVLASASALWLGVRARRGVVLLLGLALLAHAADSWRARPFYLSYFQPLAGGERAGYRYLVDSSYDWGQGLPDLARWIAAKRAAGDRAPVFLSYLGADPVRPRHLEVTRFADDASDSGERSYPASLRGGWYAISATQFQRVYLPVRGPWTPAAEKLYGELRGRLLVAQRDSGPRDSEAMRRLLLDAKDYETLEGCRLFCFLQGRTPVEIVGGSLLMFRLTDADLDRALNGPPPGPTGS
ncbi:MAG TPA: glycosyltransferase family 39 protein [Candidatus Didemnitutus sp.]|nr:glycosyltransferase family 39 protein [Candidatus Didemnitutus sp.]